MKGIGLEPLTNEVLSTRWDVHDWDYYFDALAVEAVAGRPVYFEGFLPPHPGGPEPINVIVVCRSGRLIRATINPEREPDLDGVDVTIYHVDGYEQVISAASLAGPSDEIRVMRREGDGLAIPGDVGHVVFAYPVTDATMAIPAEWLGARVAATIGMPAGRVDLFCRYSRYPSATSTWLMRPTPRQRRIRPEGPRKFEYPVC